MNEFDYIPILIIFFSSQTKPPVEREIEAYHACPKIAEGHKVDVLEWWKGMASHLPILSELAREWLCIPGASTSSERLFSASGNIITAKRTNLDPSTSKKLTLIKVNYAAVEKKMKLRLMTDEEKAELDKEKGSESEAELEESQSQTPVKPPTAMSTPKSTKRKRSSATTPSCKRTKRISTGSEDLFMTNDEEDN